ncbi:MAG TPA: CoA transferase [Streptosporangiaceae bacterium]|nr:CoA transferase [Streptosporangiaceae bacterium]
MSESGTPAPGAGPLDGVRVLDLSNLMAGPMCGMFLADFGAEVIKVEHPGNGDGMRRWGSLKDGKGLFFKMVNRNKKTITLDLHHEAAQDIVRRLARDVDVIIENYRPGTLERWGIGYEQLSRENPKLIMARITGYGQDGPYSQRRTLGTIAEAFSGCVYVSGFEDRSPMLPPFGLGDASTAIMTAYGIVMALYHRDAGNGAGQVIDSALYDGLFTLLGPHVIDYDQLGIIQERGRIAHVAPRNTYQTKDGKWIVLSGGTGRTFERILATFGASEILEDPRFADNPLRIENVGPLDEKLREVIGGITFDELTERMKETGAPIGAVMNVADTFEDPQYAHRHNIVSVPDEDFGTVRMQNAVPHLTGTPGEIRHTGGNRGEHTDEILTRLAGLSAEDIERLRAEGTV